MTSPATTAVAGSSPRATGPGRTAAASLVGTTIEFFGFCAYSTAAVLARSDAMEGAW